MSDFSEFSTQVQAQAQAQEAQAPVPTPVPTPPMSPSQSGSLGLDMDMAVAVAVAEDPSQAEAEAPPQKKARPTASKEEEEARHFIDDIMKKFLEIIASKRFCDELRASLLRIDKTTFERVDRGQDWISNFSDTQALDFGSAVDQKAGVENAAFVAALSELALTHGRYRMYSAGVSARAEKPIALRDSHKKAVLLQVNDWVSRMSGGDVHLRGDTTYERLVDNTYALVSPSSSV